MSLSVFACAYTSDLQKYHMLANTAAKFGVPINYIGLGRIHPGDPIVLGEIQTVIEQSSADYILGTDAYDTLICRWDEKEIINRIENAPGKLIFSCEMDCWPAGEWCQAYRNETPWFAINGGQSCGTRESWLSMIREMRKYDMNNCQERLHRMYANRYPIGLDSWCQIFQSFSGGSTQHLEWREDHLLNTYTASWPMLCHWNGRTPGAEDWYEKVMS